MTVSTGADVINPTHHVKLSSGSTEVGLILCDINGNPSINGFSRNRTGGTIKMYTGEAKYDDSEPPWSPQQITDFSGGLGGVVFDDDKTKYYTGTRAYTANGAFEIGPQPVWTKRYFGYMNWPHHDGGDGAGITYTWHSLTTTNPYLAVSFVPTAANKITRYHLIMRGAGTPGVLPYINVSLYTDNAGSPNELVDANTKYEFLPLRTRHGETQEILVDVTGVAMTIAPATTYWLVIKASDNGAFSWDGTCYPQILCATQDTISGVKSGTSAPVWSSITTYTPFYRAMCTSTTLKAHYFELKGALHKAVQFDNGVESKLYINGDCGVAASGTTTTCVSAAAGHKVTWTDGALVGSVLVLTGGTGSTQPRNFRLISGNVTSGENLTIECSSDDPWDVAPASGTEWAVVANDTWTVLTDVDALWDGLQVVDVLVTNGAAYFAHGDTAAMTRLMVYNNAGTWTYTVTQESTASVEAYATKLARANDPEGSWIWKARGGFPSMISKAPAVDCTGAASAADLVWEAEFAAGDLGTRLTNMLEYGEDYGQLHLLKEGDLFKVNLASDDTDYITRVPISGFQPSRDWRNGRAACVHDTYLFFSWHDTVLRYYRNYLDNIGPNSRDIQMPSNRRGVVSAMRSYPGMLYAAIDGGKSNYSSVLGYNGTGWCNLFTGPAVGHRIQNIYIQSIPGDNVDRLWISCGPESVWIPISTNPYYHPYVAYNFYNAAWDATIELGYMYAGRRKLWKYWDTLEFDEDGITAAAQKVYLNDREDNDNYDTWDGSVDTVDELTIADTAIRIKPAITITSNTNSTPVRVNALVFDAVTREKQRWVTTLTFRLRDAEHDLTGVGYDDYATYAAKLAQLVAWSETTPTILTVASSIGVFNGKSVMIDQSGIRLIKLLHKDAKYEEYIMQIQCYEV